MRRKRRYSFLLILLICSLLINVNAAGMDELASSKVKVVLYIPPMYEIQLGDDQLAFSENDFSQAFQSRTGEGIIIEKNNVQIIRSISNTPYSVLISTGDEYFTSSKGNISVANMEWSLEEGEWTPLSTTPNLVLREEERGSKNTTINFRLKLDPYQSSPGSYQGEIVYTITGLED